MNRLWTLITEQPHFSWYCGPLFSGEPQGAGLPFLLKCRTRQRMRIKTEGFSLWEKLSQWDADGQKGR